MKIASGCPLVKLSTTTAAIIPTIIFNKVTTLFAIFNLSNTIINGKVIKTATVVEAKSVVETTIGIGLINSPIIPLESKSGTKAQTVVIVVVQIGTK